MKTISEICSAAARLTASAVILACVGTAALAQPAQGGMPGGPGADGGAGMRGGRGMMHAEHGMRGEGMGSRMGMGMGMRDPGHRMERMLDAVGASAEQRAKVRDIMKAARNDLHKQREAGRALHQQMAQLMAAPRVDTAAVEATRQRLLAQHDAASKRMTQAMLDAGAVLSPEQRAKIAARRDMMERHRRERESLDGPRRN